MLEVEQLALNAQGVAEFAAAVAAAARPADGPAGLIRAWASQAALVRRWPTVRQMIRRTGAPTDAELAAEARRVAQLCREHRPGVIGKALGFFKLSPDGPSEQPAVAALLEQLAGRLAPGRPGRDLLTGMDAVLAEWQKADSAVARLVALQAELDGRSPSLGGLLDSLADRAGSADRGEAAPDVPEPPSDVARAAVGVVRLIAAEAAARTGDDDVWSFLGQWVGDWLRAFQLAGEVSLAPIPAGGAARPGEEIFPLASVPGTAASFRRQPEGEQRQASRPSLRESAADRRPWLTWADLPPPPSWGEVAVPPLVAWVEEVRAAGQKPRGPAPAEAAARTRFAHWVVGEAGREWFARCLAETEAQPGGDASRWWQALRSAGWCRAYPDLDPARTPPVPEWPADTPRGWPAVSAVPSDLPVGGVVGVPRYSPTPSEARVILSDGRPAPGSPLALFHDLFAAVGAVEAWWGEGRWDEAHQLSAGPPADPGRAAVLVGKWLDVLGGSTAGKEKCLQALGEWARGFGLDLVVPGPTEPEAGPAVVTRGVFSDLPARRVVRASGCGLTAGDRVLRQAVVEVSLGPAPPGFVELEAAAEKLPPKNPLRDRVFLLQEALRGDYLREAAVELYVDYWGETGAAVRAADPALAAEFAARLTGFLHAAYGLSMFTPTSIHDHPDGWLAVVPGGRAMTGLVRSVRRPGLQDEHGNLRIPALVEVE